MISYNFKLIIFSIILGTLTLIYNNNCDGLYKNINYKNTISMPTYLRLLAELSYGLTKNHKHENNQLREYKNTNETKYKKNKYPKDDTKRKQNIPQVTEKENTETSNLNKYKKGKYDKENEKQSNISSRSLKYLEIQRKLYNNFYVKPEMYFEHLSDKSNAKNDKSCEWTNKKKSSDKLSSSNKVHDNYLDNLKTGCVGGASTCGLSSIITAGSGIYAATEAAGAAIPAFTAQIKSALVGVNFFFTSSLETAIQGAAVSGGFTHLLEGLGTVGSPAIAGTSTFFPYGMAIVALIAVTIIVILLYIWLRKRRKNSWKHECKKHLYT
ncbi:stevor PIR protein, putative [Plasmodium sp. gorilla clade G2]|uniref:stevor PIR protein, putative n=1 Tax=Plasmodium sp. gorilla clade G2 TaxID=880535 RepID=UPI000D2E5BA1|nr:stevor PIR protein, putative [Plasmodium sp. gorilla clade G2]SOV19999.1 stevor PIR protein, putative [Plasmodium sp. gorilla clade G2]